MTERKFDVLAGNGISVRFRVGLVLESLFFGSWFRRINIQSISSDRLSSSVPASVYSEYALQHSDRMRIVAVADPDEARRHQAAGRFDIPSQHCFESAEVFSQQPKMADAVINGTMDTLHVPTSLPLIEAGYHVLLEKPIARSQAELDTLVGATQKTDQILMICHNLRHAPFYVGVKSAIAQGKIGRIMAIHTSENVGYDHMGESFVRGK